MSQSESVYLDKILKRFNMDSAKKGFLPDVTWNPA